MPIAEPVRAALSKCERTKPLLGVDPYWERIHLAYQFEVAKRTKIDQEAISTSNPVFEPGEIAHVNERGTLIGGFYDFLEWQGMILSRKEMIVKAKVEHSSRTRFCLVLKRLDGGRYIICYLTSFKQAQHGHNIQSLLGRLFAIAIDDTPEYPPGTPSIKMMPKWRGSGFLFAMPVLRHNLVPSKVSHTRYILRMGEFERVKQMVVNRVKVFKANHRLIRKELRMATYVEALDPLLQEPLGEPLALRVADEVADDASGKPTTLATTGDPRRMVRSAPSTQFIPRSSNGGRSPKLPRIHYLETNKHWLNLRWSCTTLRFDIMNSSYYLNDIDIGRRVYKGAAFILKQLPGR